MRHFSPAALTISLPRSRSPSATSGLPLVASTATTSSNPAALKSASRWPGAPRLSSPAAVGALVNQWVGPNAMRWILGLSFLAMAAWILVPDKVDDEEEGQPKPRFGVFGATVIAFFIFFIAATSIWRIRSALTPYSAASSCSRGRRG